MHAHIKPHTHTGAPPYMQTSHKSHTYTKNVHTYLNAYTLLYLYRHMHAYIHVQMQTRPLIPYINTYTSYWHMHASQPYVHACINPMHTGMHTCNQTCIHRSNRVRACMHMCTCTAQCLLICKYRTASRVSIQKLQTFKKLYPWNLLHRNVQKSQAHIHTYNV